MNPTEQPPSSQKKPSRPKKVMVLIFSIALSVVALICFPLLQTTSKVGALGSKEAKVQRDSQTVVAYLQHDLHEQFSVLGKSEIQLVREVATKLKLSLTNQEIEAVAAKLEIVGGKLQPRQDGP